MKEPFLWRVAVEAPLPPLTYICPAEFSSKVNRGRRVKVPLGKSDRLVFGRVLGKEKEVEREKALLLKMKEIQGVDEDHPPLPEPYIQWLEWISNYYMYPLGSVMELMSPPLPREDRLRKKRSKAPASILAVPSPSGFSLGFCGDRALSQENGPHLTSDQDQVLGEMEKSKDFSVHLLYGVTGSGKTEVYLRLLGSVLQEGGQGLVLVPEISLTPQLVRRFVERFGDQVAVIHSQLTPREKTNQWWDMVQGKKKILIGARSALFCPLPRLKILILDEEHEPSFKQEEHLKYHGRDGAIMLGKYLNIPVVLGSATPSLESWKKVMDGRYRLHRMGSRVHNRALPQVELVDMRGKMRGKSWAQEMEGTRDFKKFEDVEKSREVEKPRGTEGSSEMGDSGEELPFWLSSTLYRGLKETLDRKDQAVLFLNRRGMANYMFCPQCGYTMECPNCDISLTLHGPSSFSRRRGKNGETRESQESRLVCHYCDYHQSPPPSQCPDCKEGFLKSFGLGTEQVEAAIQELFPSHRVARADRDEIQNRKQLDELITSMEEGKIDILVGTQMIARGLDFRRLTLVGLVLADVGFNLPDFRATERSFQLITQVSGRSGRHVRQGESPGRVIIQTYNPLHPCLEGIVSAHGDFASFAERELQDRALFSYPPYGRMISIRFQGSRLDAVQKAAHQWAHRAQALISHKPELYGSGRVEILGPVEAPLAKIRNQYRYHILLKTGLGRGGDVNRGGDQGVVLHSFCRQVLTTSQGKEVAYSGGVRVVVDVDPVHLL